MRSGGRGAQLIKRPNTPFIKVIILHISLANMITWIDTIKVIQVIKGYVLLSVS